MGSSLLTAVEQNQSKMSWSLLILQRLLVLIPEEHRNKIQEVFEKEGIIIAIGLVKKLLPDHLEYVDSVDEDIVIIILSSVLQNYHEKIREHIKEHGIIATISDKVINLWTEDQKDEAMKQIFDSNSEGVYRKILVDMFKVDKTMEVTETHQKYIRKAFQRSHHFFPNVTEIQILQHDSSKYSFLELVGYTCRWVWGMESPLWEEALAHHYSNNPHHPQYWQGQRMPLTYLEESIIDMLGCAWERQLGGGEEVLLSAMATIENKFLMRYQEQDRELVKKYLVKMKDSGT